MNSSRNNNDSEKNHHLNAKIEKKCESCKLSFDSNDHFLLHMKRNEKRVIRICTACKKSFRKRCQWITHMRSTKLDKSETCNLCLQSFRRSCQVWKHFLKHYRTRHFASVMAMKNRIKHCSETKKMPTRVFNDDEKDLSSKYGTKKYENLQHKKAYTLPDVSENVFKSSEGNPNDELQQRLQFKKRMHRYRNITQVGNSVKKIVVENKVPLKSRERMKRKRRKKTTSKLKCVHSEKDKNIPKVRDFPPQLAEKSRNMFDGLSLSEDLISEINSHDAFPAFFVQSVSGRQKLVDPDGYMYIENKQEGDVVYWVCDQKKHCKAQAQTIDQNIVHLTFDHSHSTDIGRSLAVEAVKKMKQRAVTSTDSFEDIIENETEIFKEYVLALLPDKQSLMYTLKKLRDQVKYELSKKPKEVHKKNIKDNPSSEKEIDGLSPSIANKDTSVSISTSGCMNGKILELESSEDVFPLPAIYVPNSEGTMYLVDPDGYIYITSKVIDQRTSWTCEKKDSCRAQAHTSNDKIVFRTNDHIHPADKNRCRALSVIAQLEERTSKSLEPFDDIISMEIYDLVSEDQTEIQDKIDAVKQSRKRKVNDANEKHRKICRLSKQTRRFQASQKIKEEETNGKPFKMFTSESDMSDDEKISKDIQKVIDNSCGGSVLKISPNNQADDTDVNTVELNISDTCQPLSAASRVRQPQTRVKEVDSNSSLISHIDNSSPSTVRSSDNSLREKHKSQDRGLIKSADDIKCDTEVIGKIYFDQDRSPNARRGIGNSEWYEAVYDGNDIVFENKLSSFTETLSERMQQIQDVKGETEIPNTPTQGPNEEIEQDAIIVPDKIPASEIGDVASDNAIGDKPLCAWKKFVKKLPMRANFVVNNEDQKELVDTLGYIYLKGRTTSNKTQWYCIQRDNSCRARIYTEENIIVSVSGEHHHLVTKADVDEETSNDKTGAKTDTYLTRSDEENTSTKGDSIPIRRDEVGKVIATPNQEYARVTRSTKKTNKKLKSRNNKLNINSNVKTNLNRIISASTTDIDRSLPNSQNYTDLCNSWKDLKKKLPLDAIYMLDEKGLPVLQDPLGNNYHLDGKNNSDENNRIWTCGDCKNNCTATLTTAIDTIIEINGSHNHKDKDTSAQNGSFSDMKQKGDDHTPQPLVQPTKNGESEQCLSDNSIEKGDSQSVSAPDLVEKSTDKGDVRSIRTWAEMENNLPVSALYIPNKTGQVQLLDPIGYMYIEGRESSGQTRWCCEELGTICRARVYTEGKHIVSIKGSHTHPVDPTKSVVLKVIHNLEDNKSYADEDIMGSWTLVKDIENNGSCEMSNARNNSTYSECESNATRETEETGKGHQGVRKESQSARYVSGNRGETKLIDELGYMYVRRRGDTDESDETDWVCERRGSCIARAHILKGEIVALSNSHNHVPNSPEPCLTEKEYKPRLSERRRSSRILVSQLNRKPEINGKNEDYSTVVNLPAKYVPNLFRKPKLVDPSGFFYIKKKSIVNQSTNKRKVFWVCDKRRYGCKGKAETVDDVIILLKYSHNHSVEAGRSAVLEVIGKMKERVLESTESVNDIIDSELGKLDEAVLATMPRMHLLKNLLNKVRRKFIIKSTGERKPRLYPPKIQTEFDQNDVKKCLPVKAKYIPNIRGMPKLVDPTGYMYIKKKSFLDHNEFINKTLWVCEKKRGTCSARAYTVQGSIVKLSGNHSHPADVHRSAILELVAKMKEKVLCDKGVSTTEIISREIENVSKDLENSLPKITSLRRQLNKFKRKQYTERRH